MEIEDTLDTLSQLGAPVLGTHLVQIVVGRRVSLELDAAIPGPHLALPAPLRGHNADLLVLVVAEDAARLPPLVVGGVGHVQDIAVLEGQSPGGQAIVSVRIIVEQGPHVERSLLRGAEQGSRTAGTQSGLLLQLLDASLEPVVLLRSVLRHQGDYAAGSLNGDSISTPSPSGSIPARQDSP